MLKELGNKLIVLGTKLQNENLFSRKPSLASEIRRLEGLIQEMKAEREKKEAQTPPS